MDNFNHIQSQPFYNTIQLSEIEWTDENNKAIALQDTIEKIFRLVPDKKITPWQMQEYLSEASKRKVNINSVRRSISNLKNDMVLLKTTIMRMGPEGKNEHYYVLNTPENANGEFIYRKGEASAGDLAGKMLRDSKPVIIFEFDK